MEAHGMRQAATGKFICIPRMNAETSSMAQYFDPSKTILKWSLFFAIDGLADGAPSLDLKLRNIKLKHGTRHARAAP